MLELSPSQCKEALALKACDLPSGALRASGKLGDKERSILVKCYKGLRERFPKSPAAQRIPLTLLQGDELRSALGEQMKKWYPFLCVIGVMGVSVECVIFMRTHLA